MSFDEYQILVLREYERKRATGDLSRRMARLTPATFKKECEAVCNQRYDRKDDKTLEEFFGEGGDKLAWLKAIKKFERDGFRPLINFLKGRTRWPNEKNIELLAWLIDFKPRPHELNRIYDPSSRDIPAIEQDKSANISDEKAEKGMPADKPAQNEGKRLSGTSQYAKKSADLKKRIRTPIAIILGVAIAMICWVLLTGQQTCMYWKGDHYESISCGSRPGDAWVIPLDSDKVLHFKKIARTDTISENALGSIWYFNNNGIYECYTSPGYHPIYTNQKLRLLTDYVLIKHIWKNKQTGTASQ